MISFFKKKTDWKPVDFHHWSLSWCPKGTNKKWTKTSPPLGFQRFDMMNLEWEVLPLGHMEIEGSEDGATKRRCRADFNWKHIHGKVGDFRWRNRDFDLNISQTQRLYSYIQSKCLETRNSKCIQDAVDFSRQSLFFLIECFHYFLLTEDWVAEVFRDCVLFRLHSVRAVGSLPWEPELSICEDSLDSWCFWKFGGFDVFFSFCMFLFVAIYGILVIFLKRTRRTMVLFHKPREPWNQGAGEFWFSSVTKQFRQKRWLVSRWWWWLLGFDDCGSIRP